CSHQTSTFNHESLSPSCTQSSRLGSADSRIVFTVDQAETSLAIGDRIQTIDSVEFPSSFGSAKVPFAISPKRRAKPGPKGPDADLIRAVIEMKQRNPRWGCPRIAKQIGLAFGISINKDVVRRILAVHYPSADG